MVTTRYEDQFGAKSIIEEKMYDEVTTERLRLWAWSKAPDKDTNDAITVAKNVYELSRIIVEVLEPLLDVPTAPADSQSSP